MTRAGKHWMLIAIALLAGVPFFSQASTVSLDVDLAPMIERAIRDPTRFAVDIPHSASVDDSGTWTESAGVATWRYSVRIPTAVSMSFHATNVSLPGDTILTVDTNAASYRYSNRDLNNSELWSRIALGDTLNFVLTVPASRRAVVRFTLASLQAGYRAFGGATANHPAFDKLIAPLGRQATMAAIPSCAQNYLCNDTPVNSGPGRSTVAVVVANLVQCTGTLVGNTRNDGAPYVLTARHCESGSAGGGAPQNARQMTVYWNAVTPCGQVLATLYDSSLPAQSGATTFVEQQDAWLVRLDRNPVVSDAYYTGIDVSGSVIQGGYSVHHALSTHKQFVGWFGQAVPIQVTGNSLNLGYRSDFWGTSIDVGFAGPGASGSALFDAANRLVGSLSRGRDNTGGLGACPISPPMAPTTSTAQVWFTSLAAIWNSTLDTTSTTGTATLASVLDPDGTGALVNDGAAIVPWTFDATTRAIEVNNPINLTWNAATASSCTASGGSAGDGWTGVLPNQGTQSVVRSIEGIVTYRLICQHPNGWSSTFSVDVEWLPTVPFAFFRIHSRFPLWAGAPFTVSWTATLAPCVLSGDIPAPITGLPAQGTATVTFTRVGNVQLNLACAGRPLSGLATTTVAPAINFRANATDRRLGQQFVLFFEPAGDAACTPYGGAPDDGWTLTQLRSNSSQPFVTTPGTFTYGLTCTAGNVSVTEEVTVRFSNDLPYVNFSASPRTVVIQDAFTVSYRSNVDDCRLFWPPFAGGSIAVSPEATFTINATQAGLIPISMTCGSGALMVSTPPIEINVLAVRPPLPMVTLASTASSTVTGQSFRLDWTSSNADTCIASSTDNSWSGSVPTAGSMTFTPATVGDRTYTLACSGIVDTTTRSILVSVTAPSPPPGGGGGSGGGGGGALDFWALLALGIFVRVSTRSVRLEKAWPLEPARSAHRSISPAA